MTAKRTSVDQEIDDLDLLIEGFQLALQAANKSPATTAVYVSGSRLFATYLSDHGMPRDVAHIRREHVEAWIVSLLANYKPATASNRFRCLQQFFRFAIEEGEISESPMRNMRPPTVPVEHPGILSLDDLRAMLKTCAGDSFDDIRDLAMLRVFMTTGARLAEVANLTLEDVVITRDERHIEGLKDD